MYGNECDTATHFLSSTATMASLLERMNLPTNSLSGPIRSKSQSSRGTAAPYVRALFLLSTMATVSTVNSAESRQPNAERRR